MFTTDTLPAESQNNAKSTLQALLKIREQLPNNSVEEKPEDSNLLNLLDIPSDLLDQILKSEKNKVEGQTSGGKAAISLENSDHRKDFHYSQKLFHIADGNLYSIFSPIQGRSYGMKPSFLRKQKYTVQECHSRGRKSLRKGLKFHNFLPSESVTSEKDNGYLRNKWKVHSECRLREEHGTKQITISNWSKSVHTSPDKQYNTKTIVKCDSPLTTKISGTKSNQKNQPNYSLAGNKCNDSDVENRLFRKNDPYNFDASLLSPEADVSKPGFPTAPNMELHNGKKESLDNVLSSLLDRPAVMKNNNCKNEPTDAKTLVNCSKRRRKPIQTRRVVPYVKYLSLMEENESAPLDLSSKCNGEHMCLPIQSENGNNFEKIHKNNLQPMVKRHDSGTNYSINQTKPSIASADDFLTTSGLLNTTQIAPSLALLCPLPVNENILNFKKVWPQYNTNEMAQPEVVSDQSDLNVNRKNRGRLSADNPTIVENSSFPGSMQYTFQKSFVKESRSKTRRRSQRSVIKQKLEDTFRQNGFLVKTKQVSDGEATFCKFRQLRKYTRYYLKSWQQHLPDEVHKMWKGFLPPKTVLPPIPVVESVNGERQ